MGFSTFAAKIYQVRSNDNFYVYNVSMGENLRIKQTSPSPIISQNITANIYVKMFEVYFYS